MFTGVVSVKNSLVDGDRGVVIRWSREQLLIGGELQTPR